MKKENDEVKSTGELVEESETAEAVETEEVVEEAEAVEAAESDEIEKEEESAETGNENKKTQKSYNKKRFSLIKRDENGKAYFSIVAGVIIIVSAIIICFGGGFYYASQNIWLTQEEAMLKGRIESYEEQVDESPNDPALRVDLGYQYQTAGDLDAARTEYEKAIDLDSEYYPAYLNLASLEYDTGNYDEAIELTTKCKEMAPLDYQPVYVEGMCYYQMEEYELAMETFALTIEMAPYNIDAVYMLGQSAEALGDLETAEQAYSKAASMDPNNEEIQKALENVQGE